MPRQVSVKEKAQGKIPTAIPAFWYPDRAEVWCPFYCGKLHPHFPNTETRRHSFRSPPQLPVIEKAPCDPEGFQYAIVFPFEDHSAVRGLSFIINKEKGRFETTGLNIPELRKDLHKHFMGFADWTDGDDTFTPQDLAGNTKDESKEQVDTKGNTTLLLAIKNGDIDTARRAISTGANIDVQNMMGETPLILASKKDNAELVSILVQKGASKFHQDSSGNSAYSYARGNPRIQTYLSGKTVLPQADTTFFSLRDLGNVSFHRQLTGSEKGSSGTLSAIAPVISVDLDQGARTKTLAVLHRGNLFPSVFTLSGHQAQRRVYNKLANALLLNEEFYTNKVYNIADALGYKIPSLKFASHITSPDKQRKPSRTYNACHTEKQLMCFVAEHHIFLRSDLKDDKLRELESIAPSPDVMLRAAEIKLSHQRACSDCLNFQAKLETESNIGYGRFKFNIIKAPNRRGRGKASIRERLEMLPKLPTEPLTPKTPSILQQRVQDSETTQLTPAASSPVLMGKVIMKLTPQNVRSKYHEYTDAGHEIPRTPSPRPQNSNYLPTPTFSFTPHHNGYSRSDNSPALKRQHVVLSDQSDKDAEMMATTSKTITENGMRSRNIGQRLSYGSTEKDREADLPVMKFWGEVFDLTGDD